MNDCYPNSDVLINKYNIKDKQLLGKLENQKVAIKLLRLDIRPKTIPVTFDVEHITTIHKYLFGDIYEWAGDFREVNLHKWEEVLSGGTVEYTDHIYIESQLNNLFNRYELTEWGRNKDAVVDFLTELWVIHPFREGNTRTCVTFLWHYLKAKGVSFRVELLRNNPRYVRDALVMASYDRKEYLQRIILDALAYESDDAMYGGIDSAGEQYQIAKSDYEAFKEKYSIRQ